MKNYAAPVWGSESPQTGEPLLIGQGAIEISTIGAVMGGNILGLGGSLLKVEDGSIMTLGLSVGFFLADYAELEGSFGSMRISYDNEWESGSESMFTMMGKGAVNLTSSRRSIVPYFIAGLGVMDAEYDSEMLYMVGGGVKLPLRTHRRLAVRIEYSYNRALEEGAEGVHSFSLGFSAFFRPGI